MGKRFVRQLCAKDGGLKIYETRNSEGYLDETAADPESCASCFERLARRQFQYIDVHVPLQKPGYFRLSLSKQRNPRCEPSNQTFGMYGWGNVKKNAGISAPECVAVDPLLDAPVGPELSEARERVPNERSVDVRVDRWT